MLKRNDESTGQERGEAAASRYTGQMYPAIDAEGSRLSVKLDAAIYLGRPGGMQAHCRLERSEPSFLTRGLKRWREFLQLLARVP